MESIGGCNFHALSLKILLLQLYIERIVSCLSDFDVFSTFLCSEVILYM